MYGVRPENIIVTGFPLPKENIGQDKEVAKLDLARRVTALDPQGVCQDYYKSFLKEASHNLSETEKPLTITYAVGGAGAQKEIGALILNKLAPEIKNKKIRVNLSIGNRPELKSYFEQEIFLAGLKAKGNVNIIFDLDKVEYFKKFNACLHDTDVLWTKPSELSFYCALGLPIIMSSPIGSQEDFNREWLLAKGAGVDSPEPEYVAQWLPDLLASGRLARAAVDGFLNAEQLGVYNIGKLFAKS
jgi:hypothetical protein